MHGGWAMPEARTQPPLKEEGLRPAGHRGPHPGPGGRGGVFGLPVAAGPGLLGEVLPFPSFWSSSFVTTRARLPFDRAPRLLSGVR